MSTIIRPTRLFSRPVGMKNMFDIDSFFGKNFMEKLWDTASPAVNISESEDEYCVEIVAPGFDKDDFSIDINDDVLSITAEVENESDEEEKEYSRKEYNFSSFSHSFRLPDNVQDGSITAGYTNGILTVLLPKSDQPMLKGKRIEVQ